MIKPPPVRSGDRIALVSPASPFTREAFERGVAEIQRLGYEPVYDQSVFDRAMYTSGTEIVRAEAFTRAWLDPRVAALMAVRGGYGSVQLLPALNASRMREAPKLFIGYSDNTSLLSWLTCQCGVTALHGPMIEGGLARGAEGYDEQSLLRLIEGGGAGLELRPDKPHRRQGGYGRRATVRGHAVSVGGVARNALRVRPPARQHPVSRRCRRTSVSHRIG